MDVIVIVIQLHSGTFFGVGQVFKEFSVITVEEVLVVMAKVHAGGVGLDVNGFVFPGIIGN